MRKKIIIEILPACTLRTLVPLVWEIPVKISLCLGLFVSLILKENAHFSRHPEESVSRSLSENALSPQLFGIIKK
jgi:hypothetical protein